MNSKRRRIIVYGFGHSLWSANQLSAQEPIGASIVFKSNIGIVYYQSTNELSRNYINTKTKTLEREMTKRNWQKVEINIPGNRAILRILPSPYLVLRTICILCEGI